MKNSGKPGTFGLEAGKNAYIPKGWSAAGSLPYVELRVNRILGVAVDRERFFWHVLVSPTMREGSLIVRWIATFPGPRLSPVDFALAQNDERDPADVVSVQMGQAASLGNSAYAAVRAAAMYLADLRLVVGDGADIDLAEHEAGLLANVTLSKRQSRAVSELQSSLTGIVHGRECPGIGWDTWGGLVELGFVSFTEESDSCEYLKLTELGQQFANAHELSESAG